MSSHFKIPLVNNPCAPSQFEYEEPNPMLVNRVDPGTFEATVAECNRILRVYSGHGFGCMNIGWVCFPFMCCLCVQSCRTRTALKQVKLFLSSESQRVYLQHGIHLQLRKKDMSHVDPDGHFHKEVTRHIRVDVARILSQRMPYASSPPLYHAASEDPLLFNDRGLSPPPYPDPLSSSYYHSEMQNDFKPSNIVFGSNDFSEAQADQNFTMPIPSQIPPSGKKPADESVVSERTHLLSEESDS